MQPNIDPVYLRSQELSNTIYDRFMAKIRIDEATGCWLWTGCIHRGYGMINRGIVRCTKAQVTSAYTVSYILFHGPIPKGMCILHKCPSGHNRRCACPTHLSLGDKAENGRDSIAQGTNAFCRNVGKMAIKINPALAAEIRARWVGYRGQQIELATEYGVSRHTISLIIRNKTWKC